MPTKTPFIHQIPKHTQKTYGKKIQRIRYPSFRKLEALRTVLTGFSSDLSRKDALEQAGFASGSMKKVFNTPDVQNLLNSIGLGVDVIGEEIKKKVIARQLHSHTMYDTDLTDEQIKEVFERAGDTVLEIKRVRNKDGSLDRTVIHYFEKLHNINMGAIEMLLKMHGAYAPTKVEGKHAVGVFSLSSLRKKMEDNNIDVCQQDVSSQSFTEMSEKSVYTTENIEVNEGEQKIK